MRTLLFVLLWPGAVCAEPLIFSATGCGPYSAKEEPLLADYVKLVGADGKSEFLLHLGDIVSGSKKAWPEAQYEKVAGILKESKVPVYVVLGDNEWNDLANPAQGLEYWNKHLRKFERHFPQSAKMNYQEARPENFAWTSKNVLMVGINLVGGKVHDKKEWTQRMNDDAAWVRECFAQFKDARAAVVFAQANPSKDNKLFCDQLAEAVKDFGKPVLYLHADGHVWQHQTGWLAPNLQRVQTDQVGRNAPVQVTVTDDPAQPFVFDRRLKKP